MSNTNNIVTIFQMKKWTKYCKFPIPYVELFGFTKSTHWLFWFRNLWPIRVFHSCSIWAKTLLETQCRLSYHLVDLATDLVALATAALPASARGCNFDQFCISPGRSFLLLTRHHAFFGAFQSRLGLRSAGSSNYGVQRKRGTTKTWNPWKTSNSRIGITLNS